MVRGCGIAAFYTPPAICECFVGENVGGCSLSTLSRLAATNRTLGGRIFRRIFGRAKVRLYRNFNRARSILVLTGLGKSGTVTNSVNGPAPLCSMQVISSRYGRIGRNRMNRIIMFPPGSEGRRKVFVACCGGRGLCRGI